MVFCLFISIIIYLITVLCLIFLSINKSGTSKLIIAALGFLLLFSDPSSVGPQSFPSSGLFRFFPLVTWALYFTNGSIELSRQSSFRKIKKIFNKIILSLALITSFLWSGEMLICTLISVFLVTIFKFSSHIIGFLKNIKIRLKSENFKKNFLKIILYLSILSLIFGFILKNNILHNDFLEQIISYPFSYLNKNYGWYEPGAWITIAPLYALLSISALVLLSNTNVLKKVGFISCCGLALGYVAYRPVSNNITAVMPTVLILVASFFSKKVFLGLEQKIMKDEQIISLLPYRGIILAIAGTSAFLQLTNFQRLNQIISVSTGSSLGEFKEMGGQNIVNYPNCEEGDKSLSKLILDKELIRDIRQSKTGVSFIGHNYNYLWSLGNCHKFNGKLYHPLVFQPSQLYFPPLDLNKSKLAVKKVLEKRKFKKIVFLSLVKDDKAKLNRKYFFFIT